jgi:hypothetical protein
MFGYPSAYLGWVAFRAQLMQARKSLTSPLSSTELSKRMLTGKMDADLSFKLGNMANYTSKSDILTQPAFGLVVCAAPHQEAMMVATQ